MLFSGAIDTVKHSLNRYSVLNRGNGSLACVKAVAEMADLLGEVVVALNLGSFGGEISVRVLTVYRQRLECAACLGAENLCGSGFRAVDSPRDFSNHRLAAFKTEEHACGVLGIEHAVALSEGFPSAHALGLVVADAV